MLKKYNSLKEVQTDLLQGKISCVQLVEHYLHNIKARPELNLFIEVFENEAKSQALVVDQKIKSGVYGKLAGMVIGLKDLLCYQGHKVQAASEILEGFESQFSATAVQRLIDEDAIIIGRQNCDEFGMGSSNENSSFGASLNPNDPTKVTGGSSGASAASVKADMCLAAIGSDTGGSVRQPAAFCGVVGMKPSYSRISRHGLIAYASSFDAIGTLSNSVHDSALLLEVMAGHDDFDATISTRPVPAYSQQLDEEMTPKKVCYLQPTLDHPGLNPEISSAFKQVLKQMEAFGHQVEAVPFDFLDYILPTYYILTTAEASTNLARFDGVKYGHRNKDASQLIEMYKESRYDGFGAEVQRRILLGTFVLSASYYDAYFTKAQKVRRLIKEKTEELLVNYDFIVMPTTPSVAFNLNERKKSPLEMYLADLYTVQATIAGVPAISVPVGTDQSGLPIGFQLMAGHFEEQKMFHFADHIMKQL